MSVWVVVEVVGTIFYGKDIGASSWDSFLVERDGAVEGALGDVTPLRLLTICITEDSVQRTYSADKVVDYFNFNDNHIVRMLLLNTGLRVQV